MRLDFNEFLRLMSAVLIVLLVFQGLDYAMGFGVNNYLFIIFCIVFAFTMGSIYYNILLERQKEMNNEYTEKVHEILLSIKDDGLNDENMTDLEVLLVNASDLREDD